MGRISSTADTCPHADQIASYVSCTLAEAQAKQIDVHLNTCTTCQHVLATVIDSGVGPAWLAEFHASQETASPHNAPTCAYSPSAASAVVRPGLPRASLPISSQQRYQFVRLCGEGGMGRVWEGWDQVMKRRVALKQLRTSGEANSHQPRLLQEAASLAKLSHANIVSVFEVLELDQQPTIVMEFVDGTTLSAHTKEVVLGEKQALRLLERLADAIVHAHRQGVIHRDLKPANVLLAWPDASEDGLRDLEKAVPKLSDFGLAKTIADQDLTKTGELLGTPAYMAPEQTLGIASAVGFAADIYGLGAILYELLVGTPPHVAENPVAAILAVREHEPVSPRILRPGLSKDIETICLKCLQKMPKDRYESAEALRDDLVACLEGRSIRARPVSFLTSVLRWSYRNKPWVAAIAATILLLLTILLGSLWSAATERTLRLTADKATERALRAEEKSKAEAERAIATLKVSQNHLEVALQQLTKISQVDPGAQIPNDPALLAEHKHRINICTTAVFELFIQSLPPPDQWSVRQAQIVAHYVQLMQDMSAMDRYVAWLEKLTLAFDRLEADKANNAEPQELNALIMIYLRIQHRDARARNKHNEIAVWADKEADMFLRFIKEDNEIIKEDNERNIMIYYSHSKMNAALIYGGASLNDDAMRTATESVTAYRQIFESANPAEKEVERANFLDKLLWYYFVATRAQRKEEAAKIEPELLEIYASFPQDTPFRARVDSALNEYRRHKDQFAKDGAPSKPATSQD